MGTDSTPPPPQSDPSDGDPGSDRGAEDAAGGPAAVDDPPLTLGASV